MLINMLSLNSYFGIFLKKKKKVTVEVGGNTLHTPDSEHAL